MKNIKLEFLAGVSMMLLALTSSTANAATFGTGTTVTNNPPSFTGGPSDGGSSVTTPTNVGSNVTFTATATDSNNDQYYLAICKTNLATAGTDAAPTCDTDQTWAISTATNSGSIASVSYTTVLGDLGSNIWYAFLCDKKAADAACSSANQGAGDNGSPFVVANAGTFGTVTVTDASDATIAPGDLLKFKLPLGSITAGSNINMYICTSATTSFDYSTNTCTGGSLACSALNVDHTTTDAVCQESSSGLAPVPTAHASYDYKVYVEDSVDTPATGTNTQNYTVIDVPPVLVSYTATDTPAPTAGGSDTVDFSAIISDGNGDSDVTAVEGVLFDDDAINISLGTCVADEHNCYTIPVCNIVTGTADAELTANCQTTFWFNSNASANWEVHVNTTDELGKVTDFADSNVNLVNETLSGLDMIQASISYGVIELGAVSTRQTTTISNMGNMAIDIMVSGSNMCADFPACVGNQISAGQQKWFHTDNDYLWSGTAAGPGPYTLVNTASGTGDATGCLNRDIAIRTTHDNASTDESIWWRLKIPETQATGTYSGENIFTSTASSTCSTGETY